ncbi:hypothetical protein SAMN05444266_10788 [Chitinophaga jiangningensis]|uniref:DUF4382 domain-containing protein n=1 Tax=Chitinophaga jiangningensis TaxID=1419482 RepID=A0A1M7H539_9BACT|nr:hypothetical protein [Chitinophaga jiangningensis]SHM23695.1 hypothetical protein SAMN05444266_10788 [Chitinophaga jiangningensis]
MKTRILQMCATAGMAALMFVACNTEMTEPSQPPIDDKNAASVNYELEQIGTSTSLSADATGRLSTITGDASMARTGGFDITWDTAVAKLKQITFEAKRGKDEVEFKLKTDRYVDLLAIPSQLGTIKLPLGTYQQVKVSALVEGDKKDPAVVLKGRLTWDGKDIPMDIQLSGSISLKAQGKDVVVTDSSIVWKGKLQLSMDLLISKLQVGDFTGSFANGKITINVDVNTSVHDKIKGAAEGSMSVEHTHD